MLVGNWMTKDVISVDVSDSMQDAARLIRGHKIKRLPVRSRCHVSLNRFSSSTKRILVFPSIIHPVPLP